MRGAGDDARPLLEARQKEGPMTVRTVLLSGALAFSSGVAPGPPANGAEEKAKVAPATADLSGRWVFNRELSDDAREKMREGMERGGGPGGGRPPGGGGGMGGPGGGGTGGPGGGGRMGPPPGGMGGDDDPREAMRAIMEPSEELTIAQTEAEIEVEEKFGATRRLHPDGKRYKTDNGTSEIKAFWKQGQLVVETKRARGGRVVETWERIPDGSRLIVNVKIEGGFGPGLSLKRIYDRAEGGAAK
jgi:hypothetical protein